MKLLEVIKRIHNIDYENIANEYIRTEILLDLGLSKLEQIEQ